MCGTIVTGTIAYSRLLRSGLIFQIESPYSLFDKLICFLPFENYAGYCPNNDGCQKCIDLQFISKGWKVTFAMPQADEYLIKRADDVPKKRFQILDKYCTICPPSCKLEHVFNI